MIPGSSVAPAVLQKRSARRGEGKIGGLCHIGLVASHSPGVRLGELLPGINSTKCLESGVRNYPTAREWLTKTMKKRGAALLLGNRERPCLCFPTRPAANTKPPTERAVRLSRKITRRWRMKGLNVRRSLQGGSPVLAGTVPIPPSRVCPFLHNIPAMPYDAGLGQHSIQRQIAHLKRRRLTFTFRRSQESLYPPRNQRRRLCRLKCLTPARPVGSRRVPLEEHPGRNQMTGRDTRDRQLSL